MADNLLTLGNVPQTPRPKTQGRGSAPETGSFGNEGMKVEKLLDANPAVSQLHAQEKCSFTNRSGGDAAL